MRKLNAASFLIATLASTQAFALDQIVHPYTSIRSEGMGGLKLTTGEYAENFFGNPARVTANPRARFTFFETDTDVNGNLPPLMSSFITSASSATALMGLLSSYAGKDVHGREQLNLLSGYFHGGGDDPKMYFAFSIMTGLQLDMDMRQSYNINPGVIADTSFAVTVGRKFLDKNALSVGITPHVGIRGNTLPSVAPADLIANSNIISPSSLSTGLLVDADVGGTYDLPIQTFGGKWTAALAVNNVLGGNYSTMSLGSSSTGSAPIAQPRALGFGVADRYDELGPMKNNVFALEVQDIGNSGSGSFFRLLHIGGETHYGVLSGRLGINQGYLTAGLGVDTRVVHLELSTYGEEMSTNAGGLENRVVGVSLGLHI